MDTERDKFGVTVVIIVNVVAEAGNNQVTHVPNTLHKLSHLIIAKILK